MVSLNTIRRLTIQAEAKGFDEVNRSLGKVADGQNAVAVSSDKVVKGTASVASNLETLKRRYDATYAAEVQMAKAETTLARARAQGLVSSRQQADLLEQVRQKHTRSTAQMAAAAVSNDNLARSYSRVGLALNSVAPLLDKVGMGGSVGMVGGGVLGGLAAGAAGIAGASAAIAAAGDAWTTYENRLKAAGVATGDVNQRTKELADLAIRSRSDLGATVELYSGLRKASEDLGRTQGEVARVTETINKAFVLGGSSASTASGAILQLNQAFAAGALRGDELNSVLEGAPPLARLIAQEFGVTVGQLKSLGETGALSAERLFDALVKGSKEIDTAFASTTTTMGQASTNAQTAISQLGAEMDKTFGISQRLAAAFTGVANAARSMAGAVATYGDERAVQRMKDAAEGVRVSKQLVQSLQGKNDFASKQDLTAATAQLEKYRAEYERLTRERVNAQVPLPEPIILNGEGLVTTERNIRALTKATDDLAAAEKKAAIEGMTPLQKATQEANDAHAERLKQYERLKAEGAETARINDLVARSERIRTEAIKQANAEAEKRTKSGSSRRDPSLRGLKSDFSTSLADLMREIPGISITSGYRSEARQAQLFEEAVRKYGSEAAARKWVAPPGKSMHNKGMAADLSFSSDAVRQEAHRRAGEFNLSFPLSNESWHVEAQGARTAEAYKSGEKWSEILERQTTSLDAHQRMVGQSAGEIARLKTETDLLAAAQRAGIPVTDDMRKQIAALADQAAATAQADAALSDQQEMMSNIGDLGKEALKGFISDLRQGKSAAEAMTNALDRMADKLLDMALDSLFDGKGGLGGMLKGVFGGGGAPTISHNIDPLTGLGYHGGGEVGRDHSFTRQVDPRAFIGAPRYHKGFRPDEVPAVLQRGEWVLSKNDVAGIKAGAGKGPGGTSVTVINNGPTAATAHENPDGSIDVVVDALEGRLAGKASAGRGPLYKANAGRAANRTLRG